MKPAKRTDGMDSNHRESNCIRPYVSHLLGYLGIALAGVVSIFWFLVFFVSLSFCWGWEYSKGVFFYLMLFGLYLNQVSQEKYRFRAAFSKAILHMSWYVKYLAILTAISSLAHLTYLGQWLIGP